MADWTDPPWAQLVAGKPWSDEKAAAAFENPIAIAEGAPDAPRVQGIALGGISMGFVFAATNETWVGYTDCDNFGLIVGHMACDFLIGYGGLFIRFSTNNGSTWGVQNVLAVVGAGIFNGIFRLDLESGAWFLGGSRGSDVFYDSGTVTIPSGANAFQVKGFAGIMDTYCLGGLTS